jgi:tetratricopeptide (TPR) repeat protein
MFVKDMGGEAAFVECPSCGALALPAGEQGDDALARNMSGSHDGPVNTVADQAPVLSDAGTDSGGAPSGPMYSDPSVPNGAGAMFSDPGGIPGTGAGIFSNLLATGDPSGPSDAAPAQEPPPEEPARAESGLNFNFGDDLDVDFGNLPGTNPVLAQMAPARPVAKAAAKAAAKNAREAPAKDAPSGARTAGGAVLALPTDALDGLAEAASTDSGEEKVPWGGMSDEAFGDLEKAFDEMALRPQPKGRKGGLSADDAAFLKGETTDPGGHTAGPPGRRPAPPRPPPRRSTKPTRARPPHLTLSDEAKRLAFLPLKAEAAPRKVFDESLDRRSDRPDSRAEPKLERRLEVAADKAVSAETTDLVREKKQARVVPSAMQGLTFLRVAALVLLATVLGAAGGFFLTPQPQRPNTPRARAELKLAEGNKFYAEGRFDDALGVYREASRTDPTYALAHRAVGAALAKLQRFDDASSEYQKYLDLEPSALDAADVKDAVSRRKKPDAP